MPKNYRSKTFQPDDLPIVLQSSGSRGFFGLQVDDSDSVSVAFGPSPDDADFIEVSGAYCTPLWEPNIVPGERIEIRSDSTTNPITIVSDTLPISDDITDAFHLDVDGVVSTGCELDTTYTGSTNDFKVSFKIRGGEFLEGSIPVVYNTSPDSIILASRGSSMLVRISSIGLDTGNMSTGRLMERLAEKVAYSNGWSEVEIRISQSVPNSVFVEVRFDRLQVLKESFPCSGIGGDMPIQYFLGRGGNSVNSADFWVKDFTIDGDKFPMDEGAGNTLVSDDGKAATVDVNAFEWSRYPQ
ncbi:TonB-dependent receptor [Vibrio chagasii]|nr:TonB-dependent receptor [Vibrio chagasii]